MKIRPEAILSAAVASLLLSACAQKGNFPSLAPRAVELEAADNAHPPAPPSAPADPALQARMAALAAQAESGEKDFETEAPAARAAVARAGTSGSENWIAAQQALSRLQAARSATVSALSALDELVIERANSPTNPADFEALLAAKEKARGLVETQQAEIDRLQAALSPA